MTALFDLDDSYARELVGLCEPWQAAPAPAAELLVLNEALATELGFDVEALRSADGIAATSRCRSASGASRCWR